MAIVEIDTRRLQVTGFLPICQNQIQGLFKDLQGPYEGYIRKSKLNQTGNFISIYKHHMHIRGQKEAIWNNFLNINWFGHDVLENQIQALSTTFRHRFKDFQGPCLFSWTFQALKIWQKYSRTFKDPQEWVSEQFLNGTSAHITLCHSIPAKSGKSEVNLWPTSVGLGWWMADTLCCAVLPSVLWCCWLGLLTCKTHYRVGEPTAAWQFVDICQHQLFDNGRQYVSCGQRQPPLSGAQVNKWLSTTTRERRIPPDSESGGIPHLFGTSLSPHLGSAWWARHNNNNKNRFIKCTRHTFTVATAADTIMLTAPWTLWQYNKNMNN